MLQINDPTSTGHPIWELAFRSFFLMAAIFAVVAITVWWLLLSGWLTMQPVLNGIVWHGHEMLFGFVALIVAGFLLTAVQTWTGLSSLKGKPLIILLLFWLLTRVSFWLSFLSTDLAILLAVISSALWWLGVITAFARLVWRSRNQRNYQFIWMLFILLLLQQGTLYAVWQGDIGLALHWLDVTVLTFLLLINQIAARVVPFFTQRALQLSFPQTLRLDKVLTILFVLIIILFVIDYWFEVRLGLFVILCLGAGLHCWRSMIWFKSALLQQPLLWSLHLAYAFISLGLVILALSFYFESITKSQALHVLTIGAIGGVILAMIARVSLGHTGRALKLNFIMPYGLGMIFLSAIARFILLSMGFNVLYAWGISIVFWCLAFTIFIFSYWKILSSSRQV